MFKSSKARWYVGILSGFNFEAFKSNRTPSPSLTPRYLATIGPFKTKRAAIWMTTDGKNNPHCQTVEDAERISKAQSAERKSKMIAEQVLSRGPWMQLIKVKHCLCPDGERRTATITGQPDTAFTVPARIKYKGKTVSGFVMSGLTAEEGDMRFIPYKYRKWGAIFDLPMDRPCDRCNKEVGECTCELDNFI